MARGRRGKNPETILTHSIRNLLRLLRIPHIKYFGGPLSERGVSDIIGTIPGVPIPEKEVDKNDALDMAKKISDENPETSEMTDEQALIVLASEVNKLRSYGRAFWMEIKTPTGQLSPEQEKFLGKMKASGAIAFVARSPKQMLEKLSKVGFKNARNMMVQFQGNE